ncbi:MAG: DUF429 domain-containing protein [Thermodesulfobacteriota bacterium]
MDKPLVALGWDVRGWLNSQQATAVARLAAGSRSIEWLVSEPFSFDKGSIPGFVALAVPAVGDAIAAELRSAQNMAIAIDAPLAFPKDFSDLVSGKEARHPVPAKELENRLAYRDCERWVAGEFGRKPLSAPFDKLGNNASLAMSVVHELAREGFVVVPQRKSHADRAVIEVYPGIVKRGARRSDPAVPGLARHLPEGLEPGTDRYDAAICAVLGLVYLGGGPKLDLPNLVAFPAGADPSEGWIFTLPAEFLREDE